MSGSSIEVVRWRGRVQVLHERGGAGVGGEVLHFPAAKIVRARAVWGGVRLTVCGDVPKCSS